MLTRLFPFILLSLAVCACGDSPTGPTDPKGLRLVNIQVRWNYMESSSGLVTIYTLCGQVTTAQPTNERFTIKSMDLDIKGADGTVYLRWSNSSAVGQSLGGIIGCFGGPSEPASAHAVATSYVLRVTYTGGNGAVETSGSIVPWPAMP